MDGANNQHSLEEHLLQVASTTSTVASLPMARLGWLPSKTTTAWWLAANSKTMPLFMKCQINNQLEPDNPQHKPGSPWGKLLATYNFAASPFLHCRISESLFSLDNGDWQLAVPKLGFYAAAFCVEMWAQIGQITNTAWENTCGTWPVQLQQWHPCEWQD